MSNDQVSTRLGVCSWSLQPASIDVLVEQLTQLKLPKLQLAIDPLRTAPDDWIDSGRRLGDAGISLVSGQFGAIGEDYSSPQTIRQTGGVVPDEHWSSNFNNARQTATWIKRLGLTAVTSHAGFIPPDAGSAVFDTLTQRVGELADLFADYGATFLLETGQETADTLSRFLGAVDRPNLGVNFDPANMLLYDMGDPVAAVKKLMPHVKQVHIKDATPPAAAGAWGEEVVVGEGKVDWSAFLAALDIGGYRGDLIIEREAGNQRIADVAVAAGRIARWLAG